jgi:predicted nucleotidyltransferase
MATAPFAASKCSLFQAGIDGDLDVNGWELGKALKPLLKGNAVIIEWLRSPVIYRGDAQFREEFLAFATQYANRDLVGRHYLHLGERQRRTYFGCGRAVPQKKIFYALRPSAALRWLRFHPDQAVAPMHFATLMDESDPPREVIDVISDLIERKAMSRELGTAPLPESIANFIDTEFDKGRIQFEGKTIRISNDAKRKAGAFFRETAIRFDAGLEN